MISAYYTRPLPALRRYATAADPQRARIYRLEREFIGAAVNNTVPRKVLQELANNACRYYRIKPIKIIVFSNAKRRVFGEAITYYGQKAGGGWGVTGHEIRLNKAFHGANVWTLLHELAHYIADATYTGHEAHGKQFAGIYMNLLAKYRVLPAVAFRAVAKKHGVQIAGKFRPDAIRA